MARKMPVIPKVLENLIDELSRLPGIGSRSARRIAFHLLHKPKEEALVLAEAIRAFAENARFCSVCRSLSESDPCDICNDSHRDLTLICVVEEMSDLIAVESSGGFRGAYHVLGGVLDPLSGVGPEGLSIRELLARIEKGGVKEVIVATNPTVEGDTTSMYIAKLIRPFGVKISRIARGLPVGGDLEFVDKSTLARAIENRTIQN
jgi:recombination protein RecR